MAFSTRVKIDTTFPPAVAGQLKGLAEALDLFRKTEQPVTEPILDQFQTYFFALIDKHPALLTCSNVARQAVLKQLIKGNSHARAIQEELDRLREPFNEKRNELVSASLSAFLNKTISFISPSQAVPDTSARELPGAAKVFKPTLSLPLPVPPGTLTNKPPQIAKLPTPVPASGSPVTVLQLLNSSGNKPKRESTAASCQTEPRTPVYDFPPLPPTPEKQPKPTGLSAAGLFNQAGDREDRPSSPTVPTPSYLSPSSSPSSSPCSSPSVDSDYTSAVRLFSQEHKPHRRKWKDMRNNIIVSDTGRTGIKDKHWVLMESGPGRRVR